MEFFVSIPHRDNGIAVNRYHPVKKKGIASQSFNDTFNLFPPAADDAFLGAVDNQQKCCRKILDDMFDFICRTVNHRHLPVHIFFCRHVPDFSGRIAGAGQFRSKQAGIFHSFEHGPAFRPCAHGKKAGGFSQAVPDNRIRFDGKMFYKPGCKPAVGNLAKDHKQGVRDEFFPGLFFPSGFP